MIMTDEELMIVLKQTIQELEEERTELITDIGYIADRSLIALYHKLLKQNKSELDMVKRNIKDLESLIAAKGA